VFGEPVIEMKPKRGRGAGFNPPNRFERLHLETLEEAEPGAPRPTEFYVDSTKSILSKNDSPDVPFTYSINPYRGCEHGCIYCYARAGHEYLGFSAGIDFESKIVVKRDAPALLEKAFLKPAWRPQTVALSGATDPYQPAERRLELTRRCLEVFLKFRNPVSIITKSHLILRDIDLLTRLAALNLVEVVLSITTLDPKLAGVLEPRASTPARRLEAVKLLSEAGVPIGVNVAPLIPGLTDEEVPAILRESAARGAEGAGYILVRLPFAVKDLFLDWLERNLPERAPKIVSRLREVRGGELSASDFVTRQQGQGRMAETLRDLFEIFCRKYGLNRSERQLSTAHFTREFRQLRMF
jgi:DNA repair photolyase